MRASNSRLISRMFRLLQLPAIGLIITQLASHAACATPPQGAGTTTVPTGSVPVVSRTTSTGAGGASRTPQVTPSQAVRVSFANNRLTVVDAAGRNVIAGWELRVTHPSPDVRASASVRPLPDGFDLTYSFANKGVRAAPIAALPLPPLQLGATIDHWDFEHSGWSVPLSGVGTRRQATYPNDLYSPVSVMSGLGLTVGMSVQYPVLSYRHDVSIATTQTSYGLWQPEMRLSGPMPAGDLWWGNNASIPPNEARTYTVSFRFAAQTGDWRTTLTPYRDHFQRTYGRVAYNRQAKPIKGISLAAMDLQTPQNPNGWTSLAGAPDRNGYRTAAMAVQNALATSSRVVVWAPTGLAYQNRSLNYPPQFTSRWLAEGRAISPLNDGVRQFSQIRTPAGKSWGLWWGHAAETSPGWDTLPLVRVDPSNAQHRAAISREIRTATSCGATLIGLDAFAHNHNPLWNLVGLLDQLKQEAPLATFCSEGRACDVLHRLAPTWLDAYTMGRTSNGTASRIKGPFHLADFLVPGHETWAGMCYDRSKDAALFGANASSTTQTSDIQRVIRDGYVPVVWLNLNLDAIAASVPGK